MKAIAICDRGIEDVCAREISEITDAKTKARTTVLEFSASSAKIAELVYQAQSLRRVMLHLAHCKVSSKFDETVENVGQAVSGLDLKKWLDKKSFKIVCKRIGQHEFSAQDLAPVIGEQVLDKNKTEVVMDNPDVIIYVYIYEENCHIGIDMCGFDLAKRQYRVFTHPESLNACISYAMCRMADWKSMLDPFCGSGSIPIEAGLYSAKMSPHFYNKEAFAFHKFLDIRLKDKTVSLKGVNAGDHVLKYVRNTQHNAKLAGVKDIKVSKMDIEWMDTKFDEGEIDAIITHPPSVSRHTDSRVLDKLYKEFFHQVEYVLSKKGRIVICSRTSVNPVGFCVIEHREVWQGRQKLFITVCGNP